MRGPLFYALTRLHARGALRRQGYGFFQINEMMDAAEDDIIDAAAMEVGIPRTGLGDGTIIQAILDFLRSEQGQALISALIKLLLGALAL